MNRLRTLLNHLRSSMACSTQSFSTIAGASAAPPIVIDCNYPPGTPQSAAAYLIVEGEKAAFIDNNTNHCVPHLLERLSLAGVSKEDVEYIIVTHVHLDHAGATGLLAQHCKNAVVLAHPRAAPHIVDPSRLIQGVKAVYGEQRYRELYGDIIGVEKTRVRAMEDNEQISFGNNGRNLKFVHTRGHAKHHMIIHDFGSNSVFTGDAFGVSYSDHCIRARFNPAETSEKDALFLFPSTSPVDFEPEEALISLEKLRATNATSFYLTHFDKWPTPLDHGIQMMQYGLGYHTQVFNEILSELSKGKTSEELYPWCHQKISDWFKNEIKRRNLDVNTLWELHALDAELNAQGLIAAAAFKHKTSQK